MQRRDFPSILLYSFGLALVFSLMFNGFLLHEQSHQRSIDQYDSANSVHPVDLLVWQQQLSDCSRANQQKDSLIRRLEQAPNIPSGQVVTFQHNSSK